MEDAARQVSPDNAIGRLSRVEAMSSRQVSKSTLPGLKFKLSRLEYLSAEINKPDFDICSRRLSENCHFEPKARNLVLASN